MVSLSLLFRRYLLRYQCTSIRLSYVYGLSRADKYTGVVNSIGLGISLSAQILAEVGFMGNMADGVNGVSIKMAIRNLPDAAAAAAQAAASRGSAAAETHFGVL